jgi:hypothetical protein
MATDRSSWGSCSRDKQARLFFVCISLVAHIKIGRQEIDLYLDITNLKVECGAAPIYDGLVWSFIAC